MNTLTPDTDTSIQINTVIQCTVPDAPADVDSSKPVVYLMRGLPACGKSHKAKQLAGDKGVVLETDEYFLKCVGPEGEYSWDSELLDTAREWNLGRFYQAIAERRSPIVVDRGNGRNAETRAYAEYALQRGYRVELCEPDSPWWQEIRVLLKYRPFTDPLLDQWSAELARVSREIHRVPAKTIRRWMKHWADDLTVDDIIASNR